MTHTIRQFRADDAYMEARFGDKWLAPKELVLQAQQGEAWTLLKDQQIMGVVGIVPLWAGVYQTWAMISDEARGSGMWLTRTAMLLIDQHQQKNNAWRYQSVVDEGNEEYSRWTQALGYEEEARLYMGAPSKNDLLVYSKIYEVT